MKGFPRLTHKRILKKHKKNSKDKDLHKTLETKEIKKNDFYKLIKVGTKHKPFDRKAC